MKFREFGSPDGPLVIAVHGMMHNDFIRSEWNPIAKKLAELGFHVFLPDFHSAPADMRPGSMSGDNFRDFVKQFAAQHDGMIPSRYKTAISPKMVVMGKSWGAKMAAEAARLPDVIGTVLVVPAFSPKSAEPLFENVQGKVALAMVGDDDVAPISNGPAFRELLGERVTWIEAKKGGHRIVPEFIEPIAKFVEGLRAEFDHRAEL